jgi:prepilin-type N-terminal cleavage/methylation domain-containing protein
MRIGRARGFTFVEMIVAIMIAAALGTAVYTTFAQGIRLWTRTAKDRGEWKVDLWVEKVTEALRNSFWDSRYPLKGGRTEIFFATLDHSKGNSLQSGSPVYFHYGFDPAAGSVAVQKKTFQDILMSQATQKALGADLDNIAAFDLEYYGYDPKAKVHRWEPHWNKDCFPDAVKITIEPKQMNHRKWVRTISMPTENVCPA